VDDTLKCKKCGYEPIKSNWQMCPKCKQPLKEEPKQQKRCRRCNEELEDWMEQCPACGEHVEAEAPIQTSAAGEKTAEDYLINNGKYYNMDTKIIDKNKFFSKIKEQEIAEEQEKMAEKDKALQAKFRTLVKSSREHIMNGDFTNALYEAKKALDINPSSVLAAHPHSLIAEVYLKQNRLDEAITEINEALKFNDKYWYALCVCAKIYYVGKDYKQMKNYYFQALSSVKEKELVLESLSDIPNIDEIITNIENDEYEDEDD
jgi:tetratricopeptide (TPR) repeat protein